MVCKEGKFVKFNLIGEKDQNILAFIPNNEKDMHFKTLNIIRQKIDKNISSYQACEKKEEYNNFKTVLYNRFNLYGDIIDSKVLHFDFENETLITQNGYAYNVKHDSEYVHKIQNTQVKASDGIQGLYKHIINECLHVNGLYNTIFFNVIEKLETQRMKKTS